MSDYEVTLVNDNMQGVLVYVKIDRIVILTRSVEFYVKFHGPEDSTPFHCPL